ncbi:SRPBCC family protein [Ulvibacterium sp.]|uniref:SRPBCC family protein n=1 Tax=Ulvibacterium sp. TaxID=2665914 RepID=UPI003CC58197
MIQKGVLSLITAILFSQVVLAQERQKKTQHFVVSHIINAPADKVWKVVGEDYGAVAYSHPKILSSNYVNGSLKAGEGAERVCNFNEKGTKYIKEKMINYDPENYTFKNVAYQAGKFPVNPDYTFAVYKIEEIDDNTSRFVFDMTFRTKPAFMGGIAKGSFKRLIADYAIAIEHYVNTGEKVTRDNFKDVKKQYKRKSKT